MKVNKARAVSLMVALGLAKAATWDDDKLKERLAQVPAKVSAEDVPEGHEELYKALAEKPEDESIEFDGAAAKPSNSKAKTAPDPEPEDEDEEDEAGDENDEEDKTSKSKASDESDEDDEEDEPEEKPKAKSKSKSKSKGEKPKAPKPAAKPEKKSSKPAAAKPAPAKKKIVFEKDSFGCRKDSISGKVNALVTDEWKSEEDIAKEAGISIDQARGRLYYAATGEAPVFEREKVIRYRLKPAKEEKPKKKK